MRRSRKPLLGVSSVEGSNPSPSVRLSRRVPFPSRKPRTPTLIEAGWPFHPAVAACQGSELTPSTCSRLRGVESASSHEDKILAASHSAVVTSCGQSGRASTATSTMTRRSTPFSYRGRKRPSSERGTVTRPTKQISPPTSRSQCPLNRSRKCPLQTKSRCKYPAKWIIATVPSPVHGFPLPERERARRRREIPDARRSGRWFPAAMKRDSGNRRRRRRTEIGTLGEILLAIAIVLGFMGLCLALDDPCSGVSGCEPIVDTQTGGRQMVVVALLIGVPAAWMIHRGRESLDDD